MGSGASSLKVEEMKDISDKDLKSLAEKMEPEGIAKMKKCLKQAEAHQKKAAAKKSEERKAITKVGNSEEASEMQHAIFMWDEALVQKVLGKRLKVPKGTNGAMLVMEEVEWPTKGAASKWEKMLEDVTWEWCKSQVDADKPFMPPEKAKKHCVYLWDQKETDAFLDKIKDRYLGSSVLPSFVNDHLSLSNFQTQNRISTHLRSTCTACHPNTTEVDPFWSSTGIGW